MLYKTNNKYEIVKPLEVRLVYDEKEAKQFVGFIPTFYHGHYCEKYDDVDSNYDVCSACYSKFKFIDSTLWDGKNFGNRKLIKPDSFLKKHRHDNCVMCVNASDGVNLINPGLYEALIEAGKCEENFKGVYSKRGDILAYEFIADSTLPSGALFSARFNEAKPCRKCGNINFKYRESFEYNPYYIKKKCIDKLWTITKTSDYFEGDPILIISPELRNKIVELCPDAQFEPVWTEENKEFFEFLP